MRVDPTIAAMRRDRAPQSVAQSAMQQAVDSWRAEDGVAEVLDEFEQFGKGAPLGACHALEEVFTGQGNAEQLMHSMVGHFCSAMAKSPLGHPPFRNGYDGRASTLLLAKSGRAQLPLQAREPGTYEYPCATYTDAVRFDAVIAGAADALIARIVGPREKIRFADEPIALKGGARLSFDCNSETLLVTQVEQRLVVLRLLQAPEHPQPGREYCRDTGRLLHQSAGTLATSRREMMVALLGRMQHAEAAPTLARIALDEGDDSLRWQALRECLALDTANGFAALSQLARNADDSLAGDAGALRAQLLEAHPQLLEWEKTRCRG